MIRSRYVSLCVFDAHNTIVASIALLLLCGLVACGGNSTPPQNISVSISPGSANAYETKSVTFTATVTGTNNTAVTWSVQEGATGGTVVGGVYTAPATAGTYHVIATSQANMSKSATAAVTVSAAPDPAFTSTPSTSAAEGQPYTYTMSATDPAGGSITFSLASGPSNASISANTLTWTPTHAQSRISNAFVVMATTSEGGVAEQSFSITPNGNINGTTASLDFTEAGESTTPYQAQAVTVFVPTGNGSYTAISGTSSNGTFSISNVPAGDYLLQVDYTYLWTSASDVDFSQPVQGRLNYVYPTMDTTLNLNVTEAPSPSDFEYCYLFVPNIDVFFYDFSVYSPCAGAMWSKSYDWFYALPDAAQGDRTYLYRDEGADFGNHTWTGHMLTDYTGPLSLTIPDGGNVTLSGNMTAESTNSSIRGNLDIADLVALEPLISPTFSGLYTFRLYVQPFTGSYFLNPLIRGNLQYTQPPDSFVIAPYSETGENIDLGDVAFSNPFPSSWAPYAVLTVIGNLPYTADGASNPWNFVAGVGTYSTTFPTEGSPIAPLVGQATGITINGNDFYTDQPNAGAEPVVAWNPPAVGSADGYYLIIYQLVNEGGTTFPEQIFVIATDKTSITLPPSMLLPGYAYVFQLTAFHGNPNVETAPLYNYFPWGYADAFSGYVHVSSGAAPAKPSPDDNTMRRARQRWLEKQASERLHPAAKFGVAVPTVTPQR